MTLPRYAFDYGAASKEELRTFVMRRLGLSGGEFANATKHDLICQLRKLDNTATIRFTNLVLELREHVYEHVTAPADFIRLCYTSKTIRKEARDRYYKNTQFYLTIQAHSTSEFKISAGGQFLRIPDGPLGAPDLIETIQLQRSLLARIRHLTIRMVFGAEVMADAATVSHAVGATSTPRCLGANRGLFSICAFYAFRRTALKDVEILLEMQPTYDELGVDRLRASFWPLKLLGGKVNVNMSDLPLAQFASLTLNVNDVSTAMNTAGARYVGSFLTSALPMRRVWSSWMSEGERKQTTQSKLECLRGYIDQHNARMVEGFLNRVDSASGWNDRQPCR